MKKLIIIKILTFIIFLSYGQVVNYYTFKDGSGTTLTDKKGSANGTLAGASLPVWDANGYLEFTGGHSTITGDYNRVNFTRTTFDYSYNNEFSWIIIFRSLKNDAVVHYLVCNRDFVTTGINCIAIRINASEGIDFVVNSGSGSNKVMTGSVNFCDGKWHIASMGYSTNSMVVYIDGKNYTLTTNNTMTSGNMYSATNKMLLGAEYINPTYQNDLSGDITQYINANIRYSTAQFVDFNNEFFLIGW
jgi:hypothetical protein